MEVTPQPTPIEDVTPGEAMTILRRFTTAGSDPYETVEWERRDARIGHGGRIAFEQCDVEFPRTWSQNATNIVAQKYFRGQLSSPTRERSVKQMIGRVAGTISGWGRARGYFASEEAADAFEDELTFILLHQLAAFNSPVWFNVGFEENPQCSACFILSVEDTIESILDWNTKEGMIFRGGSGSGINLSNIRGSMEPLAKGGTASGPVSFMRGADAWAGTIKSGGKTRRAAKMVVLNIDHPDIREFIACKAREEDKAAGAAGRGLRHVDRRGRVPLDPVPEREQLGPRDRRVHAGGRRRRRVAPDEPGHRPAGRRAAAGTGPDARARAGGPPVRGSGRPVRHDDQPVAHVAQQRADQRVESVLRIHARRRLGLQPGVAQPDEVPPGRRELRRRGVRARGRRRAAGPGDHRRSVELSDRGDRRQRAGVPPARPRLREPRARS